VTTWNRVRGRSNSQPDTEGQAVQQGNFSGRDDAGVRSGFLEHALADGSQRGTETASPERRAHPRFGVNSPATLILVRSGSRLYGKVLDLSAGGCRICLDEDFLQGIYTRVETEFYVEGTPLRLGGVVQAIQRRRQLGIRFLEITERKRRQLLELIEEMRESRQCSTELSFGPTETLPAVPGEPGDSIRQGAELNGQADEIPRLRWSALPAHASDRSET
jgi:hypothetical protein